MRVRLLKHLGAGFKVTKGPAVTVAALQSPPQAYQFVSMFLEEYSALCQAARTISSFLLTLVGESRDESRPFGGIYCTAVMGANVTLLFFPPGE